uniref:DUF3715 domain-containing protein n=1 Tax=Steinernema glaseri TaxID=37863 RepID=A0A1I7Z3I3_9BILA
MSQPSQISVPNYSSSSSLSNQAQKLGGPSKGRARACLLWSVCAGDQTAKEFEARFPEGFFVLDALLKYRGLRASGGKQSLQGLEAVIGTCPAERILVKEQRRPVDSCGGAKQLEQFVLRGTSTTPPGALKKALKVCKEYHHNHFTFVKPSCIYKYEDTCEGQRRFYVSFDHEDRELIGGKLCLPAGPGGHNALRFLSETTFLRIFFT